MNAEKLSISLPIVLAHFVKHYQLIHEYKSKSEVIQDAIKLLQQQELEKEYAAASNEIDPAFDIINGDGLDDETW